MTHDFSQVALAITLLISAALLAALVVGLLALWRARSSSGEPKQTLWLIALHLLEAPVNALIIVLTLRSLILRSGWLSYLQMLPPNLAITLPMAVLLIPALGLRFRDRDCRWVAGTLLVLGLLRWLVTAGIFAFFNGGFTPLGTILNPFLLLCVGTTLLLWCAGWCAYLLNRLSVRSTVRRHVHQRVERVCGDKLNRA